MQLLAALTTTGIATAVRNSNWLFPAIETLHVLAIVLVVGTIAIVDLRLIGVASCQRSIVAVTREVLPYTRASFGVAAISGALLFMSSAPSYVENGPFRIKMLLLLLAGGNMLLFHWHARRQRVPPAPDMRLPLLWRAAGMASLLLWMGVVVAGRWIGFQL